MNLISQSAFLKALGWALLDSLWQMGLLWVLHILITANGKKFMARQRHTLALFSLIGGSCWFVITLVMHYLQASDLPGELISSLQIYSSQNYFVSVLEPSFPIASLIYLLAIPYLLIRFVRQYRHTQDLFASSLYKANPDLRIFLKNVAIRMGIKKEVRLWLSGLVDTPLTIGFWKPIILLPVASINNLSVKQAEAIILHELYHIKRNDYVVNLLIAFMDILLFFNPFVRSFTNILKKERENSCDDMVLQFQYEPAQYANALLMLEKTRVRTASLSIAATGKNKQLLLDRVKRILNKKGNPAINYRLIGLFVAALIIAIAGVIKPEKLSIDTASDIVEVLRGDYPVTSPHERMLRFESSHPAHSIEESAAKNTERSETEAVLTELTKEIAEAESGKELEQEEFEINAFLPSFVEAQGSQRDYSIPPTDPRGAQLAAEVIDQSHPYIPTYSFSYHVLEDTALPKKHLLTASDLKAREARDKALKALEEIDWLKLEKELSISGKKINVVQLQGELKKAITDVDWKKINEETEASLIQQEAQILKEYSPLRRELEQYQHQRKAALDKIEKNKDAIILDRIKCSEAEKSSQPSSRKKIVII